MLRSIIRFFLENQLVTALLLLLIIAGGLMVAPFNWDLPGLPRDPVPVDAIPDIGENQQIVFTEWPGRSPQDIEDQISYPLTTALLGIPGVKSIRSHSLFGRSSIYLIFEEEIEFYWSRSRILEKLNSLPRGTLPPEVAPALGPDATALGQVFWYTLEGRDAEGNPAGGWDPQELRTIQDFYVGYALATTPGVAEVAAIGGFVKEYQIDMDPDAMKSYGVSIDEVMTAVRKSNLDVGARTLEVNRVEYLVRGIGYVKSLADIEESVVKVREHVPVRIKDIARVQMGPASRRGGLDKGGAEATGAVVVARYGSNPMAVIEAIKQKIKEIGPGLPVKTLSDGSTSTVTLVPFYDRSGLIRETLGTLEEALSLEILISMLVVIVLVFQLRASFLIAGLLPLGVLMAFMAMWLGGVEANIVALSGIAIAIGVMVDVGVVISENMLRHLQLPGNAGRSVQSTILEAVMEVAPAVLTAVTTTVVSFLPVFAMQAAEGKLFRPLAFTKTFAMLGALVIGLVFLPMIGQWLLPARSASVWMRRLGNTMLILGGIFLMSNYSVGVGMAVLAFGLAGVSATFLSVERQGWLPYVQIGIVLLFVWILLSKTWLPLGPENSLGINMLFVGMLIGLILLSLMAIVRWYPAMLGWCLNHKGQFLLLPALILFMGVLTSVGFEGMLGNTDWNLGETAFWKRMEKRFPGVKSEFMPALDEGSFLLMPSSMPHAGVAESVETVRQLDMIVEAIPEVDIVVGKWGRTVSALDPAPISMFENVINYKPEYELDVNGRRIRFQTDDSGEFVRDEQGALIPDPDGQFFRNWRDHIRSPHDIWEEIESRAQLPGLTPYPKLQPIQTRLIMISTGMRAPMGIKVFGPDLNTIEAFGIELESLIREVPGVDPQSVFAERIVGKPYLEIEIDRVAIGRYGLTIEAVQRYLEVAVGGMRMSQTVEGRERFDIRLRYARELRGNPGEIGEILIPTPGGAQVPLAELATFKYVQGPQAIKSENTFLVSYVLFDKEEDEAEVEVVNRVQTHIQEQIDAGSLQVPIGVSMQFAGNYENQVRAVKQLRLLIPLSLVVIFLILYLQFRSVRITAMIFSGVFVALSGGFFMLWLYHQSGFMDFSIAGQELRHLFQIHPINMSVAVAVGFIALFGISTDDGVLMGTYLKQTFDRENPVSVAEVRKAVIGAGTQRIRPAMMTTATTLIALLPVLTATGKGADIMIPMAIPTVGGMLIQVITVFIVPVLYASWKEKSLTTKT